MQISQIWLVLQDFNFAYIVKVNQVSIDVKYIWNNSYIWTAVVDQSEEWSSQ